MEDDPVRLYLQELLADQTANPALTNLVRPLLDNMDPLTRETILNGIYQHIWTIKQPSIAPTPAPAGARGNAQPTTARGLRAFRYKRYHKLYEKDRASLANLIGKGLDPGSTLVTLPLEDVRRHYMEVFVTEPLADPHFITDRKEPIRGLYSPFT